MLGTNPTSIGYLIYTAYPMFKPSKHRVNVGPSKRRVNFGHGSYSIFWYWQGTKTYV